MKKKLLISLVILMVASLNYTLKYLLAYIVLGVEKYNTIQSDTRNILIQSLIFLISIITAWALSSFSVSKTASILGVNKPFFQTVFWALLCATPMLIGGIISLGFNYTITVKDILITSVWAGIFEELVFRAFIVGLLVRLAGWHIVLATLISSLIFGWGHIYQADNAVDAITIFLFTSGAGIGFVVFYRLWKWNIWFPMFMHIFMNLAFVITNMGTNVLLNNTGNAYRIITIVFAIILTIVLMYKKALPDFNTD